jgi:hypothetical protein
MDKRTLDNSIFTKKNLIKKSSEVTKEFNVEETIELFKKENRNNYH